MMVPYLLILLLTTLLLRLQPCVALSIWRPPPPVPPQPAHIIRQIISSRDPACEYPFPGFLGYPMPQHCYAAEADLRTKLHQCVLLMETHNLLGNAEILAEGLTGSYGLEQVPQAHEQLSYVKYPHWYRRVVYRLKAGFRTWSRWYQKTFADRDSDLRTCGELLDVYDRTTTKAWQDYEIAAANPEPEPDYNAIMAELGESSWVNAHAADFSAHKANPSATTTEQQIAVEDLVTNTTCDPAAETLTNMAEIMQRSIDGLGHAVDTTQSQIDHLNDLARSIQETVHEQLLLRAELPDLVMPNATLLEQGAATTVAPNLPSNNEEVKSRESDFVLEQILPEDSRAFSRQMNQEARSEDGTVTERKDYASGWGRDESDEDHEDEDGQFFLGRGRGRGHHM